MELISLRLCHFCGVTKPLLEFSKNYHCYNGYTHKCKDCGNAYERNKYAQNIRHERLRGKNKYHRRKERNILECRAKHVRGNIIRRCRITNTPLDSTLTKEDFMSILNIDVCPICCGTIDQLHPERKSTVDRILPKLGYVRGNITGICMRCNRLKNDASPQELRWIADWIESRLVKK